ncbi:prepilin-type N-terminal cleavage/methylation domain-containing protein [Ruminococcaceae bacterium R-25]|nr:prepilin-type N-terminal cleavage/methylation domain-containing protein [Ruminococcaceae bacterium R-25]SUQ22375.1 prepilin-type N-terminal cleavage/methylation domain-containing protein [Oscillospiraceae bacterium]
MKKMRNSKRGFSLTEIIVVIAIIVIVASAAFVGIAVVISNAKDNEKKSWRDKDSRELFEVEAWDEVDNWTYNVARFFDASTYKPAHTNTPTATPTPTTEPTSTPTPIPQNGSSSNTNTPTPPPSNTPTAQATATTAPSSSGSVNLSAKRNNSYTNNGTGYYQQYVTFDNNNFAGKTKLVMTYTYTGGSVSNVSGNWNSNDSYSVNGKTITVTLDMNSDTWRFQNGKEIYIQIEGSGLSGTSLKSVDAK